MRECWTPTLTRRQMQEILPPMPYHPDPVDWSTCPLAQRFPRPTDGVVAKGDSLSVKRTVYAADYLRERSR